MQIVRALHTALLVSNLERAEYFYGTVLGLAKVERPLSFAGTWYQVADYQIHLISAEQCVDDRVDCERWGRNRHVAFAVTDVRAAKDQLLRHGHTIQMSASGRAALFTEDPDGNLIELSQM
ncbi:VOC family protein [Gloeobacter morelensis]|uniref:VOC family protein n=1 Tax=Gloeobacter morelensis MG652769 TaxID=2781736 RepID=A0ABY3PL69_9CYAN|nr:VOC family protein [Gloeobacter morelensis]UFP94388.1 VOC family protein [Gloeobacter morelensis MG652769]